MTRFLNFPTNSFLGQLHTIAGPFPLLCFIRLIYRHLTNRQRWHAVGEPARQRCASRTCRCYYPPLVGNYHHQHTWYEVEVPPLHAEVYAPWYFACPLSSRPKNAVNKILNTVNGMINPWSGAGVLIISHDANIGDSCARPEKLR